MCVYWPVRGNSNLWARVVNKVMSVNTVTLFRCARRTVRLEPKPDVEEKVEVPEQHACMRGAETNINSQLQVEE